MRKIIALCFSDFHLALWPQFNEDLRRTKIQLQFLEDLKNRASQLRVPILFAGDFFHDPKYVHNELLNLLPTQIKLAPAIIAIPGNHDQSEVNYQEKKSPNYITWLSKQNNGGWIDSSYKWWDFHTFCVGGIPYIKNNRNYEQIVKDMRKSKPKDKPSILLVHTNIPGAKEPSGIEIDDSQNITRELHKYFKGFDLVLSGHIHRFQKLSSHVYMIGATSQQKTSDMGCPMGYLEIYDDLSVKHIDSKQPEYKYYEEESEKDDYHFWLPKIKESEATEEESEFMGNFEKGISPVTLGKNYLKVKGIKDKGKKEFLIKILNKL